MSKHVRVFDGAPPQQYRIDANQAYLVRDACVYTTEVEWDPLRHQLTAEYANWLNSGGISADFCFPLESSKTWGAPHWGERPAAETTDWRVVKVIEQDPASSAHPRTFHITSSSSYNGSGMTVDVWFERNVGVDRRWAVHHGTYGEERTVLVSFAPQSSR